MGRRYRRICGASCQTCRPHVTAQASVRVVEGPQAASLRCDKRLPSAVAFQLPKHAAPQLSGEAHSRLAEEIEIFLGAAA